MPYKNVREILRTFYDEFGWQRDKATGDYKGDIRHMDSNVLTQAYMHNNEMRYQKYFKGQYNFFIDCGCGAEHRLKMGQDFRKHVCVDISIVGLKEAKKNRSYRGVCNC